MTDENQAPALTETKTFKQHSLYTLAWEAVGKGDYLYCLEEERFYHYRNGYWEHIYEVELITKISKELPQLNGMPLPMRKQVIENLKLLKHLHLDQFNASEMLNLKNGMIDPLNGMKISHDKNFNSTIQLDYIFNKEASCPLWLKTIGEIFQEDEKKIALLQEFFGYCLVPDVKQKKAMLLLGDSDSGKSTILNILRAMIGAKNCGSVPLKYLSNPQYTPMLINKLVNIDADVDKNASSYEAEFKIITSGEPVACNQKFIAAFEFIPRCRIVLAANIFPKITDHSSAFYKRLVLIPCDRIFEAHEQNRNLASEIMQELPGVLNWSIEGLRRLNERGRFEQHEFMRDAVAELENENNPSNLFIDEFIEISSNHEIEKGELYNKYKNWCHETNNFTLSQSRFASCVFKRFHKESPKDSRNSETKKRVWKNITWKTVKQKDFTNAGWAE